MEVVGGGGWLRMWRLVWDGMREMGQNVVIDDVMWPRMPGRDAMSFAE